MRREATIAILTTSMLLAAGCIASPQEVETASATLDSPLLESLYAYEGTSTMAGDAIVLRSDVSTDGGTAAFWWDIPEGVILGDDEDEAWIEFLAAPVLLEEERAPLERWMLMAFLADDGLLALNSLAFGAPLAIDAGGPMGGATDEVERSLEPFLFGIGGKLRPGGRVGFVISGAASENVEMALVLLPLQKAWDEDEDLPADTEEFLAALQSHSRVALPPAGTGGAHQLAFHYQALQAGFGRFSVTSGPVTIEGGTTDAFAGARRSMTVAAEFASGGYAIAAAAYEAGSAAGTWAASADAHGAVSEGEGTLLAFLSPGLMGWPFVMAMGEGDAPSSTWLALDTTSVIGDGLFLIQLDLDTTLEELLGLPALELEGMAGTAQTERDGNALKLKLGDATVRAVGLK